MKMEIYKGYRITADVHNRLENQCAVRWEVLRKTKNGWESIEAFVDYAEKEITDEEAIGFGIGEAIKYVDEKL